MQVRLINRGEVLSLVPFCNSTLHKKITEGKFPPSVRLGAGSVAWIESEIQAWTTALIAGKDIKAVVSQLVANRISRNDEAA